MNTLTINISVNNLIHQLTINYNDLLDIKQELKQIIKRIHIHISYETPINLINHTTIKYDIHDLFNDILTELNAEHYNLF